ncbi:Cell adhesion molecule 2 [Folsomia candida]|uniref:Cell adhesion molecule 2 n=1 Tax=Folsomia candida TaxID=158441 RepID=A0A226EP07_FOLCA|nr:Cell adhesion molecule 2 [Folsomia candida]
MLMEGKPLPEVKWFKNGVMIDSTYEFVGSNYAVNELRISNLGSSHSADLLTCQASNNNESRALSHNVNLDVYLGVKEVDLEVPDEMTAGNEYLIRCKSVGAYPEIKIEFWKMQKRLGPTYQARSEADNVTTHNFLFKPEILDDEETISCRAENPRLNEKPMVARKTMRIKYTPVAILRFGQNKTNEFTEGETCLMECHVRSSPPIFSLSWFHGKNELVNDETTGIRLTGMTLILTYLKTNSGGKYFCQASNVIGKGRSNPLTIELNIAPKCVSAEVMSIPLAIGESHKLSCNILAWPPDLNFYWTLSNRSNDTVPILPMVVGNHTQGAIEVIPLEDFDEYIFPITRAESDSTSRVKDSVSDSDVAVDGNSQAKNFTTGSSFPDKTGRNGTGLSLTDTEKSEGGSDGNPTKASTSNHYHHHHRGQATDNYLRMWRKSEEVQEKELKLLDEKEDGLKGRPDVLIHSRGGKSGPASRGGVGGGGGGGESLYGIWKPPEDNLDNIHHEAILSYTIKHIGDYGLVKCWARNSFGKQLSPCSFHIIPSRTEANQDEAEGDRRGNESLTRTFQTGRDVKPMLDQPRESGILVPTKLPMTSGITLTVLLIFIVGLSLLALMLAKRRRQLRRIIRTNKKQEQAEHGPPYSSPSSSSSSPTTTFSAKNPPPTPLHSLSVRSSAIEKCASTSFLHSHEAEEHPICTIGKDLSLNNFYALKDDGCSSVDGASYYDLTSEATTFTVISNQNNFPPPPTSIISTTASTSHGYGSIEEDEDEEVVRRHNAF